MPFKSHWFIIWKVETVIVFLHNSFDASVCSLAWVHFLFVLLCPSISSCPSSFHLLNTLQQLCHLHCVHGCTFTKLIWASQFFHVQLFCTNLPFPSADNQPLHKTVLAFHDCEPWQNWGGSIFTNAGKQNMSFGNPSRSWTKAVWFGDPPEGRGPCCISE